jgi:hypothetical protein
MKWAERTMGTACLQLFVHSPQETVHFSAWPRIHRHILLLKKKNFFCTKQSLLPGSNAFQHLGWPSIPQWSHLWDPLHKFAASPLMATTPRDWVLFQWWKKTKGQTCVFWGCVWKECVGISAGPRGSFLAPDFSVISVLLFQRGIVLL